MSAERRQTWMWIAVGATLSVLMRVRMYWVPVSADEGGYLAIARAWSHGAVLYRDVWVDRPQGLLVLFRLWDWLSGSSTPSIRIMAMLFGVVLVVATALAVGALVGWRAARFAAVLTGVVSAAPVLEGHTANGELLSGALSAACLAVAAFAATRDLRARWYFAAGILAGLALSLKQSGFDGLVAVLGWMTLVSLLEPSARKAVAKAAAAMIAGLSIVFGAMMLHGALTGWSRWWSAVAGYRLKTQSAFSSAEWGNLRLTARPAVAVLGAVAVAALVATPMVARTVRLRVPRAVPQSVMLILWVLAASFAFLIGGGFWRHYWLLLAAPLSALASVAIAKIQRYGSVVTMAMIVPCVLISVWVFVGTPSTITIRAASDHRSPLDLRVAHWFAQHRKQGESLFVLCASSAVYADAHQDPGYPYLWFTEVRDAPQSQSKLVAYLSDPVRSPQFIADYQSPLVCDTSGRVGRILREDYKRITAIGYVTMFERSQPSDKLHGRAESGP